MAKPNSMILVHADVLELLTRHRLRSTNEARPIHRTTYSFNHSYFTINLFPIVPMQVNCPTCHRHNLLVQEILPLQHALH